MRHTDDLSCPSCDEKLLLAHVTIASWFKRLKKRYPSVHVSCAYRNAEDQAVAFREGKSLVLWPHSKHNAQQDGKPCARALDLFQIDEDGVARFSKPFYEQVHKDNIRDAEPITWGDTFKKLHDYPHFELKNT